MKQIKKVLFAIRVDLPDPLLRLTRLVNADLFNRREFAMDHLAQLDDLVASERARDASRIYCWEQSSDRKRLAELAAAALPSLHNVWQVGREKFCLLSWIKRLSPDITDSTRTKICCPTPSRPLTARRGGAYEYGRFRPNLHRRNWSVDRHERRVFWLAE